MKKLVALAAGCAVLTSAASAGSVEEVRVGVFAQGCCGFGSSKEDGAAINGELAFKSPRVLSVIAKPRPVVGVSIATDGDATNQIYSGLEWRLEFSRWFVAPGVGLTIHDGETDRYDPVADAARVNDTVFYGCRVLFRLSGDVEVHELHWRSAHGGHGDAEAVEIRRKQPTRAVQRTVATV